jgi:hypothetical protein
VWWLYFERDGRLLGVAIVEGSSLPAACLRASLNGLGKGPRVSITGHELDPRCRAVLTVQEIGRMLSLNEAANLLERFERASAKKPPAPSIRRLRALALANFKE